MSLAPSSSPAVLHPFSCALTVVAINWTTELIIIFHQEIVISLAVQSHRVVPAPLKKNIVTIIAGWFRLRCLTEQGSPTSALGFSWLFHGMCWYVPRNNFSWKQSSHHHSSGGILVLRTLWLQFHTIYAAPCNLRSSIQFLLWLCFRFQVRIIAGFNLLETHILLAFREQPQCVQWEGRLNPCSLDVFFSSS